jgi:hypothetical protein
VAPGVIHHKGFKKLSNKVAQGAEYFEFQFDRQSEQRCGN